MGVKLAKKYILQSSCADADGRPCWVQKVRKSKNLYIFAQACKPAEKNFPCVETMLVSVSSKGEITEYGKDEVLGKIAEVSAANGRKLRAIKWVDGTDVTWIETHPGARH